METTDLPEEALLGPSVGRPSAVLGWQDGEWGWEVGGAVAQGGGCRGGGGEWILSSLGSGSLDSSESSDNEIGCLPSPMENSACWEDLRHRTLEFGRQLWRQQSEARPVGQTCPVVPCGLEGFCRSFDLATT